MPQEITPDTTYYLVLGYAAFAIIGGGYLLSLVARARKLHTEHAAIKHLGEEIAE